MKQLTAAQSHLVLQLEDYSLKEMYSLIGTAANSESGAAVIEAGYVLGTPENHDRGFRIIADVRETICASQEKLTKFIVERHETLEPLEWASVILDVILAVKILDGVPPLAIAIALGKLCNRTISKICP